MLRDWMARLDEAARASDAYGVEAAIEALSRASPVRVMAMLVPGMNDPLSRVVEAHALAAEALLRRLPARSFWAVDRATRTLERIGVPPARVEVLAELERGRVGALALAAMQRNGWARARASELLHDCPEACALSVLITRTNDPVREIAEQAERSLSAKLEAAWLTQWVACLPLVGTMDETVRAAHSTLALRVRALLLADPRQACEALARGTRARDPDVRAFAISTLARRFPARSQAHDALAAGLHDADPHVRRGVAELLVSKQLSPELSEPLLPRLEHDRAPAIRMLGLRWRRKRGDAGALLRACFDRNAGLRHYARRYHRRVDAPADYRALALERLESSRPDELIGALATLSDLGRAEDSERIAPFAEHAQRRVRSEALRTLAMIS